MRINTFANAYKCAHHCLLDIIPKCNYNPPKCTYLLREGILYGYPFYCYIVIILILWLYVKLNFLHGVSANVEIYKQLFLHLLKSNF